MAKNYAIPANLTTPNSATLAAMYIHATAAVRARLFDLMVGSTGAPADNAARFAINRITSLVTGGTGVTPIPLDNGDVAAICAGGFGGTGGGTLTTPALLQWGQNQRATFRWVAAPGAEIVSLAGAAAGLVLMNPTVNAAFTMEATLIFNE
jgi:hypothetical protein